MEKEEVNLLYIFFYACVIRPTTRMNKEEELIIHCYHNFKGHRCCVYDFNMRIWLDDLFSLEEL